MRKLRISVLFLDLTGGPRLFVEAVTSKSANRGLYVQRSAKRRTSV